MRKYLTVIFLFWGLKNLNASPQSPDYLIIAKDTFPLYFLPLHQLDTPALANFYANMQKGDSSYGFSFNLWRGYQAFWQLLDGKLYLTGLRGNSRSGKILEQTFHEHYENGKVHAYWFSGTLAIGRGKLLRWDGIFSRNYFKEDVFEFKDGILIDSSLVDNYIQVKHGISRLDSDRKHIVDLFFSRLKKLNWKKLSACDCDDQYTISINEHGQVGEIELIPYTDNKDTAQMEIASHKVCVEVFKKQLKKLRFDIVKWHGKPFNEKYYVEMFYTAEGKLENWMD